MDINSIKTALGSAGNTSFLGGKPIDYSKIDRAARNVAAAAEKNRTAETVKEEPFSSINRREDRTDWRQHENGVQISAMIDEANAARDNMRAMIEAMIGGNGSIKHGQGYWAQRAEGFNFGRGGGGISEADRLAAAEAVSEDGYWGVSKTSERIFDFAVALAGSNQSPEMIDRLWNAAVAGFENAAKHFGGMDKMPDISRETFTAVNTAFETWQQSVISSSS